MSVLDGPGEGTWSVFAQKVVEERDEAREKLAKAEAALAQVKRRHDAFIDVLSFVVRELGCLAQKRMIDEGEYRRIISNANKQIDRISEDRR